MREKTFRIQVPLEVRNKVIKVREKLELETGRKLSIREAMDIVLTRFFEHVDQEEKK